jgi:iron complex transport system substrate-binding protein
VCADIRSVGEATGRVDQANTLVREFENRIANVERSIAGLNRPRVLCLEWLDPLYVAGHWVPEMIERAGAMDIFGHTGRPSFRVEWEAVIAAQPDVIVIMPCGYTLAAADAEFRNLPLPQGWKDLPAVRDGRVYGVEASGYFSRPGPRLATGMKVLAGAIHEVPKGRLASPEAEILFARIASAA